MSTRPDPVVERFVNALNANDRTRLFEVLADDATMSDDGADRDVAAWTDSEIFDSHSHLDIESVSDTGTELTAHYTNSRWGPMRTAWRFVVDGDKISRFETGQAAR